MSLYSIINFTLHGSSGVSVLAKDFLKWLETHRPDELGDNIVAYSWHVREKFFEINIDINKHYWRELPDSSGFTCFEREVKPDNCALLDVYGKERMRLTVPWQMTGSTSPQSGQSPTSFENTSTPYINLADGKKGKFGVTAWVEHAGKYYFELNYHTGQFLWCKPILRPPMSADHDSRLTEPRRTPRTAGQLSCTNSRAFWSESRQKSAARPDVLVV